jgi:erythromycin esterase-like protein
MKIIVWIVAWLMLAALPVHASEVVDAARQIRSEAGAHRLILLGEMHGTREVPLLVGELVAQYASEGPVVLGLEVHRQEQAAIDRYLATDGSPKARDALRAGAFWRIEGTQHDGRRNLDVLDLIERVRDLRSHGRSVSVLPFDDVASTDGNSQVRDASMATRLRNAFIAMPRGRLIALSGNVHAMLARPGYAPAEMQTPMGSYLRDLGAYSVNITARSGEFWACMPACGPVEVATTSMPSHRVDDGVYDYEIVLPQFTVARLMGADTAR